jgi:hypothetical protein
LPEQFIEGFMGERLFDERATRALRPEPQFHEAVVGEMRYL